MIIKSRVIIKKGWSDENRRGRIIGENIYTDQSWTPVLWDEEEGEFYKTRH